jgi:hypothetical protein
VLCESNGAGRVKGGGVGGVATPCAPRARDTSGGRAAKDGHKALPAKGGVSDTAQRSRRAAGAQRNQGGVAGQKARFIHTHGVSV